jgi:hypothetical protein
MRIIRVGAAAALIALPGCTVVPLPPPPPAPLVALPGPGKTEAAFRQDDAACRADAASLPPPGAQPGPVGQATLPQMGAPAQEPAAPPPGAVYLSCMAAHNDVVQPLPAAPPLVYGVYYPGYPFYPPYPLYAYAGYPWLYDGYFGFGVYGGCCGGGFHDGGFHGGGFRGGFGGGGGGFGGRGR